ncbi:MAG TPA: alginate export family protein, partial [bacterium]|nr:alginate export family protein [bacterium]
AQDEDFEGAFLPFEAKTYGQIADSFVFTNAHIFHLTGGVEFNEQWGLDADWYYFLLDEDEDISQPELTGFRGWGAAEDDDLGFELDVQLNYAFNESLGTFVGGGIFWPGDAIEEMSPTGDDDEAFFIRTGVKVAF